MSSNGSATGPDELAITQTKDLRSDNARFVMSFIGVDGKIENTMAFELPEGFRWDAETAHVVDFLRDQHNMYLVRGIQVNAVNPA